MSSQEQMISTLNSHGYAQLTENEPSQALNPNSEQQNHMNFAGQGNQPIVQGIPVMIHPTYAGAAPMNNFEIYHPPSSPLQKLDSCGYVCYKYWVIVRICLALIGIILLVTDYYKLSAPLSIFGFTVGSWDIFQHCVVFLGIRERSLEKMEKAVRLMNYFIILFFIYDFFYNLVIVERKAKEFPPMSLKVQMGANIASALLGSALDTLLWMGIGRYPATKVRDILKAASAPQSNSLPHTHVNV